MSAKLAAFRLDPQLLGDLQAIKRRDGIPISEQVRRALQTWVEGKGLRRESDRKASRHSKRR